MADIQFPGTDFGGSFQSFMNAINQFKQTNPNATPEETQLFTTFGGIDLLGQQASQREELARAAEEQRQLRQAKERQKLGEESVKKSLLYSMIGKLPEQIANAFNPYGGPAGAAMAWQGMREIPGIYNETLRSTPSINIPFPGSSTSQMRYF